MFPTMTNTWKFSRVGLTNVIPLPEGGGPYTIGLDKAGATYTAQLFWSPNLDASPLDDSWNVLTDINTTDEVDVPASLGDVRAIMGRITVAPTGDLIPECEISVTTANSKGVQNKRRHASGYGADLIAGGAPVQDEYAALVLADMGVTAGSFFAGQDGLINPLTDSGPNGPTAMNDNGSSDLGPGPWEGSQSFGEDGLTKVWMFASLQLTGGPSEVTTIEGWFMLNRIPTGPDFDVFKTGTFSTHRFRIDDGVGRPKLVLGGAQFTLSSWTASTAYVSGDRVNRVSDNGQFFECELAGTSGASEPTWAAEGATTNDNGITWRSLGLRQTFHDADLLGPVTPAVGEWFHLAGVRESNGDWNFYYNGQLASSAIIADDDTTPGSFGVPKQYAFTVDYADTASTLLGDEDNGMMGRMAYIAAYTTSLTASQILAHYNKGVELGLN